MELFLSSLKIVAPLFVFMAMGYILARTKIIDDVFGEKITKFCFKFAMPLMLMNNMYKADIASEFNLKLILFYSACTLIVILICWFTVPAIVNDKKISGVIIQAAYRGNFMLFAFHIVDSLYGDASLGLSSAVFACATAVYNFAAVVILSHFGAQIKPDFKKTVKDIALNPLILGTLVGVILSLTKIQLGDTVNGVLDDIGSLVTPMMLIALGGKFKFKSAKKNIKYITGSTITRLLLVPLFIIGSAILCGFRGMELGIIVALSSAPVATSSYPMAAHYKCDAPLAGELIIFSSAFSTLTIFAIIYILKAFALL